MGALTSAVGRTERTLVTAVVPVVVASVVIVTVRNVNTLTAESSPESTQCVSRTTLLRALPTKRTIPVRLVILLCRTPTLRKQKRRPDDRSNTIRVLRTVHKTVLAKIKFVATRHEFECCHLSLSPESDTCSFVHFSDFRSTSTTSQ